MPTAWIIVVVVLWLAVIALAVTVIGLLRQVSAALERAARSEHDHRHGAAPSQRAGAQGPVVGSPVAHFVAHGGDAEVTRQDLLGQPLVLLFLSAGCTPCQVLAEQLRAQENKVRVARVVVVAEPRAAEALGLPDGLTVVVEADHEVSMALNVWGTPFAIALGADGVVRASYPLNTLTQLDEMAAAAAFAG